jgi:UDP-glucose 4-epimerase
MWRGKRILVTGGSGFIGSHLVRRLVDCGGDVAITSKRAAVAYNTRVGEVWDRIAVFEADLRDRNSLSSVTSWNPTVIFHLAAFNHAGNSFYNAQEALECNAIGTANLLDSCQGYDRFVYVSTSDVYGHQPTVPFAETMDPKPISPYSIGKYAGELYARMYVQMLSRPIVIVRPFNAFGPNQSTKAIISEIIETCLEGKPVLATSGRQTRDFNFVDNLVDGLLLAAEKEEAVGQVINLGSGEEISIKDLIVAIHRDTNSRSELKLGALEHRPNELWRACADNRRAKELLGWRPQIDFLEGLRRTVAWQIGNRSA